MTIVTAENGSTLVVEEQSHPIVGRYFSRRDARGDLGDLVQVVGTDRVRLDGVLTAVLIVRPALGDFGECPPGWEASTVRYDIDDFQEEYQRSTGPTAADVVAQQLTAAETQAAAAAARIGTEAAHLVAVQERADAIRAERSAN